MPRNYCIGNRSITKRKLEQFFSFQCIHWFGNRDNYRYCSRYCNNQLYYRYQRMLCCPSDNNKSITGAYFRIAVYVCRQYIYIYRCLFRRHMGKPESNHSIYNIRWFGNGIDGRFSRNYLHVANYLCDFHMGVH